MTHDTQDCRMCSAYDIQTPAVVVVDAIAAVAEGLGWTYAEASAAGYTHAYPMCAECMGQLLIRRTC